MNCCQRSPNRIALNTDPLTSPPLTACYGQRTRRAILAQRTITITRRLPGAEPRQLTAKIVHTACRRDSDPRTVVLLVPQTGKALACAQGADGTKSWTVTVDA